MGMLCIKELKSPSMHHVFVEEAVIIVVEKKQKDRNDVGLLLNRMVRDRVLDVAHLCKGLAAVAEVAPDFAVDIPHMYKYLGEVLGALVHDGSVPLTKIVEVLRPLSAVNKVGVVMAETLCAAVQVTNKEDDIAMLWSKSGLTWEKLLPSGEDVDMFVKDRKVAFTMKSTTTTNNNNSNNNGHSAPSANNNNNILYTDMLRILSQNTSGT